MTARRAPTWQCCCAGSASLKSHWNASSKSLTTTVPVRWGGSPCCTTSATRLRKRSASPCWISRPPCSANDSMATRTIEETRLTPERWLTQRATPAMATVRSTDPALPGGSRPHHHRTAVAADNHAIAAAVFDNCSTPTTGAGNWFPGHRGDARSDQAPPDGRGTRPSVDAVSLTDLAERVFRFIAAEGCRAQVRAHPNSPAGIHLCAAVPHPRRNDPRRPWASMFTCGSGNSAESTRQSVSAPGLSVVG